MAAWNGQIRTKILRPARPIDPVQRQGSTPPVTASLPPFRPSIQSSRSSRRRLLPQGAVPEALPRDGPHRSLRSSSCPRLAAGGVAAPFGRSWPGGFTAAGFDQAKPPTGPQPLRRPEAAERPGPVGPLNGRHCHGVLPPGALIDGCRNRHHLCGRPLLPGCSLTHSSRGSETTATHPPRFQRRPAIESKHQWKTAGCVVGMAPV